MPKKIKKSKVEKFLQSSSLKGGGHEARYEYDVKKPDSPGTKPENAEEAARPGWLAESETPAPQFAKKKSGRPKKRRNKRGRGNRKSPDITPLQAGSVSVVDLISPASVNLIRRDYIAADGMYFAYLYVAGYGCKGKKQNETKR